MSSSEEQSTGQGRRREEELKGRRKGKGGGERREEELKGRGGGKERGKEKNRLQVRGGREELKVKGGEEHLKVRGGEEVDRGRQGGGRKESNEAVRRGCLLGSPEGGRETGLCLRLAPRASGGG